MKIVCRIFLGGESLDNHIEETLSLSPLYVTMTEEEKLSLIRKIISHLEYIPDYENNSTCYINVYS